MTHYRPLMKYTSLTKWLLAIALLALWTNTVSADGDGNVLSNGDFSNGKANWKGDIQDLSDGDVTNIASPMGNQKKSSGIILTLKPDWTRVSQVFSTRETTLGFSMNFQVSTDFAETPPPDKRGEPQGGESFFMANLANLVNIPLKKDRSSHRGEPVDTRPFIGLVIVDIMQNTVFTQYVPLKPIPGTPQIVSAQFDSLEAHEEKTFYAFFPPGTGTVTFYNISLTKAAPAGSQPGAPVSDRPFSPGALTPPAKQ
jgi:hypothetical protein